MKHVKLIGIIATLTALIVQTPLEHLMSKHKTSLPNKQQKRQHTHYWRAMLN